MCVLYCVCSSVFVIFFFFKQKTAYDMRISDWSSDVCSSDLHDRLRLAAELAARGSGSAQHIASRELDQIVPLFQALGLSSLARARRSQQNDIHPRRPLSFYFLIRPSYWCASRWAWIWPPRSEERRVGKSVSQSV